MCAKHLEEEVRREEVERGSDYSEGRTEANRERTRII